MEENTQSKQTWVALRHALAKHAHCTEKEAASFLESLVHQLTIALQNNQSIRINNLGTFRLQSVAPRKSVHVGTGEAITIAGYNKLTFAPEASVKESMNDATTVKLAPDTDPLRKLGEQADEILGILAEMGQTSSQAKKSDNTINAPETHQEETKSEPIAEDKESEVPIIKQPEIGPAVEDATTQKKSRTGLTVLITVVFFILLCVGAYFFLQHKLVAWMDSLREKTDGTEWVITEEVSENKTITEEADEVEPLEDTTTTVCPDETGEIVQSKYQSFITTEEMHADSRLAWMAYRYWGKKDLWVYLYDANRDQISNPNLIKVGTPIRIPRLTKEQQDLSNPETIHFIEQIQNELR